MKYKVARYLAKNDGYIKNQNIQIKQMRITILWKILAVVLPLAFFILIVFGISLIDPPPEKWKRTQITFSKIILVHRTKHSSYMLVASDGEQYFLPITTKEMEFLSQQLIPDEQYDIVYAPRIIDRMVQSLSSAEQEFIELNESVAEWKKQQKGLYITIAILFFLMLIGSILIYILWCKKELQQIKKLKSKISERLRKRVKQ